MPGSMRRQNRAIAISAPVLPAETATSASPFFTASIASHIDDVLRPWRSAWLGLSSMLTATSVWTIARGRLHRRMFGELGFDLTPRSPTSRNSVSGCRRQRDRGAGNDDRCPDDHHPWRRARFEPFAA